MSPGRRSTQNGDRDWENGSTISSTASIPEYTGQWYISGLTLQHMYYFIHYILCGFPGPKLYKEPSFKSNKFIIHNAVTRCCLAGKVNEPQKNKIVEVSHAAVSESTRGGLNRLGNIPSLSSNCINLCFLCRKWKRAQPTTFLSSSEIPAASFERFIPWTLKLKRWSDSLASGLGSLLQKWWNLFTSTALTASNSLSYRPKPCPWVSMPLPYLVTFGKNGQGLRRSLAPLNKILPKMPEMILFRNPCPSDFLSYGQYGSSSAVPS